MNDSNESIICAIVNVLKRTKTYGSRNEGEFDSTLGIMECFREEVTFLADP